MGYLIVPDGMEGPSRRGADLDPDLRPVPMVVVPSHIVCALIGEPDVANICQKLPSEGLPGSSALRLGRHLGSVARRVRGRSIRRSVRPARDPIGTEFGHSVLPFGSPPASTAGATIRQSAWSTVQSSSQLPVSRATHHDQRPTPASASPATMLAASRWTRRTSSPPGMSRAAVTYPLDRQAGKSLFGSSSLEVQSQRGSFDHGLLAIYEWSHGVGLQPLLHRLPAKESSRPGVPLDASRVRPGTPSERVPIDEPQADACSGDL